MASASISTPYGISNSGPQFNVFINHLGSDVKKNFASHLYDRVSAHGISVFLDIHELEMGDYLAREIEEVIKTASVHIPIFSRGYADSRWCLDELVQLLESGKTIIPVFYDVSPSDLQRKDGVYAEALRKHEARARYPSQTIEAWRTALNEVADKRGFELVSYNGDEGLLLEKVVQKVVKAWQAHDQLEVAASHTISLDVNGPLALQQPPESSNNNEQPDLIETLQQPRLENSNNNQQHVIETSESNSNNRNSRGRGYAKNISIIFATGHAAILTAVSSMGSLVVSSMARKYILLVLALFPATTIGAFVIKSVEEFQSFEQMSGNRSQQRLCDSIGANWWWVIKRIALVLNFVMVSLFLLASYKSLLKIRHH